MNPFGGPGRSTDEALYGLSTRGIFFPMLTPSTNLNFWGDARRSWVLPRREDRVMATTSMLKAGIAIPALTCAALVALGCTADPPAPELDLPPRPGDAPSGAEVSQSIRDLDLETREERVFGEIARGNVPRWLRRLEAVEISEEINGVDRRITFWTMPDYLVVGSDDDYVHVPLSPQVAQRVADLLGGSLPTPKMVDAIWTAADVQFAPFRIGPGDSMGTVGFFERHDRLLRGQANVYDVSPGDFIAGHKLDVVVTPGLSANPGKVALYGLHTPDGRPVQPLYTGSSDARVLFRHGIRLVHREVLVDGAKSDLLEVLRDPGLSSLLSSAGPISEARYPIQRDPG